MFEKRKGEGKGKPGNHYDVSSLPDDLKLQLHTYRRKQLVDGSEGEKALVRFKSHVPARSDEADQQPGLSETQLKEAIARADLVRIYRKHYEKAGKRKKRLATKREFIACYNQGKFGTYPELFDLVGSVTFSTLERWDVKLARNNNDPIVLADRRGKHRRGKHSLSERQLEILLNSALNPSQPGMSEIIRIARTRMEAEGIPCCLQDRMLRNILKKDEERRNNIWVGAREGEKAHNEKCVFHVRRDWNRINVGDILIADGHKLNFEILCPYTGKPKRMTLLGWYDGRSNMLLGWEIMPTENVQCISAALRRAIVALGKWPLDGAVAYMDNGKAFRAKFFNTVTDFGQAQIVGLYDRLGMETVFAWPYHAESKPVEGFFGIFAEAERRVHASYTGTSIEKKPPHLKRGEKLHKALHEKYFQDYKPTIYEAHTLIAAWLDEYSHRKQKAGHLKGQRPIDVFMAGKGPGLTPEQMAELRLLMMPTRPTKIKRDGIELPGRGGQFYYHPALFGRKHSVLVRHDWHPDSSVYVYDLDGTFICEATLMPQVHPAAGKLGTEEEMAELKRQIEMKRRQEKQTFGVARELLKQEILPDVQRQIESMGIVRKEPVEKPEDKARNDKCIPIAPKLDDEARARIQRELQELAELNRKEEEEAPDGNSRHDAAYAVHEPTHWELLQQEDEPERYDKLLEYEARGMLIPKVFQSFMRYFEGTQTYRVLKDHYEERRVLFARIYQSKAGSGAGPGELSRPCTTD